MTAQAEIAVDAANQLGEGIVWSPPHRKIFWTDIIGKAFWSFDPATRRAEKQFLRRLDMLNVRALTPWT